MLCSKNFHAIVYGLAVIASLLFVVDDTRAETTVLQGIQITEKADAIDLQIDFAIPLRYARHFPPNAGEILQVQLQVATVERPKDATAATDTAAEDAAKAAAKRESMLPPANDNVPLINVTYEGDVPGGPFLTLRFKMPVEYTLTEGAGGRSLIVTVKKDVAGLSIIASAGGEETLMSEQKMEEMMIEARQSLARDDNGRAIQLLTKMLQMPTHSHTQEAKELIGVAREKKGQIARAKLEYQEYLRLYPEGEGAERVKQRLAAIELAQVEPREKLKAVTQSTTRQFDTFGRFSQRYYKDITDMSTASSADSRATLTSFLNVSSRYRSDEYDARGFFNAYNVHTMEGAGEDDTDLNSVYVDLKNRQSKYSASIGRQSSNKGGIFGRYDGIWGSYEYMPRYEVSAAFGKPVAFSSSDIRADRKFFGVSTAVANFKDKWDANAYYIQQTANGITDRSAVGGDLRYADKIYSMFASVDYDVSYGVLNVVFLRGGWKANDQTRIDVNYSQRQSPLIMTTNALQQEGTTSFQDLQNIASESAIREKVPLLSSLSRMLTVGAVYEFDQNNQVNADLTVSSIDGKSEVALLKCVNAVPACDPGTEVIAASDKYGPEYSLSAQIISSNYFIERDIHIFGTRFSSGENRSTTSLFVRSRFPYGEQWYVGPRIQIDRSQSDVDNSRLTHPSLAVKFDYRWKKQISFEGEIGYELNDYSGGNNPDYSRTTLFLGYNVDF